MNVRELKTRLIEEGCNAMFYSIGRGGSDCFCHTQDHGAWRVFYTERGQDSPPIFETASEKEACDFFFQKIMGIRHDHLVGFFRSEDEAQSLALTLSQHGLESWQDKIPYGGADDPRFRVFVSGKAIFKARELFGRVPLQGLTRR
jgi:hypothetical protein